MSQKHAPALSRRRFLVRVAGGAMLALTGADLWSLIRGAGAEPAKDGLMTRVTRPQLLETPVEDFTSWITPNERFFVRSHFGPPPTDALHNWRLHVEGDVARSLTLSLADLQALEEVTVPAVVQCSGNGRAFFTPKVPGAQWEKGAVGNARWTGVRLADVLKRAGVGPRARHLQLLGADRPVLPTVPLFTRSIPLEKAMHPATLLAYRMNGDPLPLLHGAPLRVIVPGWAGDACVKWLTHLTLREHEADGFYMQTAYRMPIKPVMPGAVVKPSDMVPVEDMVVQSLIARPTDGAALGGGVILVEGVAWTGEAEIVRVDVSVDGGKMWSAAELIGDQAPYAWRLWRYRWREARPGAYTVMSRAADSRGHVQPMAMTWNPSGYLWNAVDHVNVRVTG